MAKKEKQVAPVLLSSKEGTGIMRGRDVVSKLVGKIDPEVVGVIAKIAEINHINMKAIAELATNMDRVVDMIRGFSDIAGNMKERTDQMARAMGEGMEDEVDAPHSNH